MLSDVSFDRLNEVLDRAEATSADGLSGDLCEPSLDLVDPGTSRKSKMQDVAWASSKPVTHPRGVRGSRLYKTQMPIKEMGIFWSALIVPNASQSFSRWAEYYLPLSFV